MSILNRQVDPPHFVWADQWSSNLAPQRTEQVVPAEPFPSDCPVLDRAFSWIHLILPRLNLLSCMPPSWRLLAHCNLIEQDLRIAPGAQNRHPDSAGILNVPRGTLGQIFGRREPSASGAGQAESFWGSTHMVDCDPYNATRSPSANSTPWADV